MHLTESTSVSAKHPEKAVVYYLRTFSLTCGQLRAIISAWELKNKYYEEMVTWVLKLQHLKEDKMVYIRYIWYDGKTKGGYDTDTVSKIFRGPYRAKGPDLRRIF
jgi:hypothetical protein